MSDLAKALNGEQNPQAKAEKRKEVLGRLERLLEEQDIELSEVGSIEKVRVNEWEVVTKDSDGAPTVTKARAASIVINPAFESGPKYPLVQPAQPVKVQVPRARRGPELMKGWKTAYIEPDTQFGFMRHTSGALIPIHDPRAVEVGEMIAEAERPHRSVNLGDYLDLAEAGKYRLDPTLLQTVQPAVDEGHRHGAVIVECTQEGVDVHEGNHDARMPNDLLDKMMWAFGLKRANAPKTWPVLSVPFLCRFDELGIRYQDGYPAGYNFINDNLCTFHGFTTSSKSSAAASKVVNDEMVNSIFGHDHKTQTIYRTVGDRGKQWRTFAHSPGTLARIDGYVPGAGRHRGRRLDGAPRRDWQNWQQGVTIVRYQPDNGKALLEHIEIEEGVAYHRGQEFRSAIELPYWKDFS